MADGVVLFEAGHAGCAFLQEIGMHCEFKVVMKHIWQNNSFSEESVCLLTTMFCFSFTNKNDQAYPALGHTLVDEELQYFRQWIKDRLSQGTGVPVPSLSDKMDLQ